LRCATQDEYTFLSLGLAAWGGGESVMAHVGPAAGDEEWWGIGKSAFGGEKACNFCKIVPQLIRDDGLTRVSTIVET
jgi:hypothetical protein